jgi:hypothetical protein
MYTTNRFEKRLSARMQIVPIVTQKYLVWVPARYRTIAAITYDGRPLTIREIAERAGYSISGAWAALRQMARLGLGVLRTSRGCHGKTSFKVQRDVAVANVRCTEREIRSSTGDLKRTVVRTFHHPLFDGGLPGGDSGRHAAAEATQRL